MAITNAAQFRKLKPIMTRSLGESGSRLLKKEGVHSGIKPTDMKVKLKFGFKQTRSQHLRHLALVYAKYADLLQRSNYGKIADACANHQKMMADTNGKLEPAVIRCILGLKWQTQKRRNQQRAYVAKFSRAIFNLMKHKILPEQVYAMKPGPGCSLDAFAKGIFAGVTKPPSQSTGVVNAKQIVPRIIGRRPSVGSILAEREKLLMKKRTELSSKRPTASGVISSAQQNSASIPQPAPPNPTIDHTGLS